MKPKNKAGGINLTGFAATSLLDGGGLDVLQQLLTHFAPKWTSKLHLWRYQKPAMNVDPSRAGALKELALTEGLKKGKLFEELKKAAPQLSPERRAGSMELRGAVEGLTVVLLFDDWVFKPLGSGWVFGNSIAIQIRKSVVEGREASDWAKGFFSSLCHAGILFYGYGLSCEEYDAKNMLIEGGTVRALGIHVDKALPGLYWLNYFGRPYVDLIGHERLLGAPAYDVRDSGSGCLLTLSAGPTEWNTPEYRRRESAVLRHLGERYFFSRDHEDKSTVSPFDLPKRNDGGKVQAYVDVDRRGDIHLKNLKISDS